MPLIKFVNHVDAGGYEIRNRKIEAVSSLPQATAANAGQELFQGGRLYVSNGTSWTLIATDSEKLDNQLPAFYLDRSKHTGTISSAVIADFDAQVRSSRLDQMALPTATVNINTQTLAGVKAGTAADHAVNKAQLDELSNRVDAGAAGVIIKQAVRVVGTSNVSLTGVQTVDGILLAAGDRVLLAGQTDAKANGIYVVAAAAWARSEDANETGELAAGTLVAVREGSVGIADSLWGLTTDEDIVIGTTAQNWAKVIAGSTGGFTVAGAGLQASSGTVSVKPGAGIIADGSSTRIDPAVVSRVYKGAVPAGSASATVTHNLNTQDISIVVYDVVTNSRVWCGEAASAMNSATLDFGTAPTSGQYRVVITTGS